MIDIVNKEIKSFLSSIDGMDKNVLSTINEKYSTTISDDLKNGHLTSNVCMVAASILNLNPKDLAKELEEKLKKLNKFQEIKVAGPGFINISLNRKDFISILDEINNNKDSVKALLIDMLVGSNTELKEKVNNLIEQYD